ncbi:hypothetical protein [Jhaorihella thermophila]|uniref:hypothetical protein n=1 Tax=Jhaorihella thermophila TaxID=488547 RepID=UPI003623BBDC
MIAVALRRPFFQSLVQRAGRGFFELAVAFDAHEKGDQPRGGQVGGKAAQGRDQLGLGEAAFALLRTGGDPAAFRLQGIRQGSGISGLAECRRRLGIAHHVEQRRQLPDRRGVSVLRLEGAIEDPGLLGQSARCRKHRKACGRKKGLGAKAVGDVDRQRCFGVFD